MCFIKFMGREVCVAFDTRDGYVLQKTSGYAFVVERKLLCLLSSMLFCNQRQVVIRNLGDNKCDMVVLNM